MYKINNYNLDREYIFAKKRIGENSILNNSSLYYMQYINNKKVNNKEIIIPRYIKLHLQCLHKENLEQVCKNIIKTYFLFDNKPKEAFHYAMKAANLAGRIGPIREIAGLTAYAANEFKTAISELKANERITGSKENGFLISDLLRRAGKINKAIDIANLYIENNNKSIGENIYLYIVLSDSYRDLGNFEKAKKILEVPSLNSKKIFSYSPVLFTAYSEILKIVNKESSESVNWLNRSKRALTIINHAYKQKILKTYEMNASKYA